MHNSVNSRYIRMEGAALRPEVEAYNLQSLRLRLALRSWDPPGVETSGLATLRLGGGMSSLQVRNMFVSKPLHPEH